MTTHSLIATEFPASTDLIYLNHAAVAPWPKRTADAVCSFARENYTQGAKAYPRWLEIEQQTRVQLAQLINAPGPDDIALLKNTSEGLSQIAYGLDWQAGDNIVISDEEFPSNRVVWQSLAPFGVEVREISLHGRLSPEQALLAATDARTRLLSISSVQYASGLRMDLQILGQHCRQHDILFCIDAIQSLGAIVFDAQACHADFVVADGHKWMLGPEGVALFYVRPEIRSTLKLHEYGWHMLEHSGDYQRKDWGVAATARRFECGSANMLGIHALHASLSLLLEIGIDEVEAAILERSCYLIDLIHQAPELQLLSNEAPDRIAGIVSFAHTDTAPAQLHQQLMQHNVVCAARGAGVRFSPHFYSPLPQLAEAVNLARLTR
ncbi:MAG: aminotransferase class V-fold PLP-dependent enzyme [Gammaproteobacteria bacterium]|nr:aminotransferase class V-fold PLP-dependent enzyme [Gammaproteobacteria bacterium]